MNNCYISYQFKLIVSLLMAAVAVAAQPTTAAATGLYATDSDPQGQSIVYVVGNNSVTTHAVAQSSFGGLAFDAAGNLYATDYDPTTGQYVIDKIVNGQISNYAIAQNSFSGGLAFDAAGNLYATDYDPANGNKSIIDKIVNGSVMTYATTTGSFEHLAVAPNGSLYATESDVTGNYTLDLITNGNVTALLPSTTGLSGGLAIDASGNLYVTAIDAVTGKSMINKIVNGTMSTYATAQSRFGESLAFDPSGNLYATDYDPTTGQSIIDLVTSSGVTTYATAQGSFGSLAFNSARSTQVPEPFTIVGTLIGGTAAIRLRKKLKARVITNN
jgi:streptogramin lyase